MSFFLFLDWFWEASCLVRRLIFYQILFLGGENEGKKDQEVSVSTRDGDLRVLYDVSSTDRL